MTKMLTALSILMFTLSASALWCGQTIDLSGKWEFRMDPQDVGIAERWFEPGTPFPDEIEVPGAWNAQGKGTPSEKLFHDFPGPAWYRRTVDAYQFDDRIKWLKFGGVHRYADVWVNGKHVGEHIGYVAPFEFDVTGFIKPFGKATIVVRVDARQRKDVDPLMGCFDIIDAVFATWGGLYRGVELEATGGNWIEDVYVVPHIADRTAEVRITLGKVNAPPPLILEGQTLFARPPSSDPPEPEPIPAEVWAEIAKVSGVQIPEPVGAVHLIVEITDQAGKKAGSGDVVIDPEHQMAATIPVRIFGMRLWSPKDPYLYSVKVTLESEFALDSKTVRFGMREIAVKDGQFMLNGEPVFLRGYGDDCVYPNTIAPPADKGEYCRRFRLAKDYGFNYVRHHSWFPLQEYFEVADELGIMLQPEFPIAYREYYDQATPEGKKLYLEQWKEAIKAARNHPSIITWSMSNEEWGGFDLAAEMYKSAKELDPTRLIVDSDGVGVPGPGVQTRETLDFLSCQFDEWGRFGFNDGKYDLGYTPDKPILVHEMSNFGTFPSLDQADLFKAGIKPWWLYSARDLAQDKGVTGMLPRWVAASNKLQALALKTNIEAARRSPSIKGYHQWLLQDYWTGSNGVLDMFYRPKGISAEQFRRFNAPTILLMDCPKRGFAAGERVTVTLLASRYEDKPSKNAVASCELLLGRETIASEQKKGLTVKSGGNTELLKVDLAMPEVASPARLTLEAELTDENGKITNSWDLWVFPTTRVASRRMAVVGAAEVKQRYPDSVTADKLPADGLLVARRLNAEVVSHLERGGRVILLSADGAFPVIPLRFKPCWWLGDTGADSNVGTLIAKDHPSLAGFPNEGWCDLQFYDLIVGSKATILDGLPVKIDPIVRCLDVHASMRNKAYLFEAKVGRGRMLVSSFDMIGALRKNDAAGEYLLDSLVRYALGNDFSPEATIPIDGLKSAAQRVPTPPDAALVNGFAGMVSCTNEPMEYASHRDVLHRCWYVRQLDGAHRMEWVTAPVTAGKGMVSLVWTGAMGYASEPSGNFSVALNGKPLMDCDVTLESKKWTSADEKCELLFDVRNANSQDAFGVMYLTVPASMLESGKPARISVSGSNTNSRRWFMVLDYGDTPEYEGL